MRNEGENTIFNSLGQKQKEFDTYEKTTYLPPILEYLKIGIYANIPDVLWNRKLWFYDALLREGADAYPYAYPNPYSEKHHPTLFFVRQGGHALQGVVSCCARKGKLRLKIVANDIQGLKVLIQDLTATYKMPIEIQLMQEKMGRELALDLGTQLIKGRVRYWRHRLRGHIKNSPAHQLGSESQKLGTLVEMGPNHQRAQKSNHIQFYGFKDLEEGQVRSLIGVAQVSLSHAEMVGLHTPNVLDRQRGYAKALCAEAVVLAHRKYEILTWTTHSENEGSGKLAHALGFEPVLTMFRIEL